MAPERRDSTAMEFRSEKDLPRTQVLALYSAVGWSAAEKPDELLAALRDSHAVVTAWDGDDLVGLGNAITDGHLVVYYPHLLVHPLHQSRGIGTEIARRLLTRYDGFHQHILVADEQAIGFYMDLGFRRAAGTESMWIYDGDERDRR